MRMFVEEIAKVGEEEAQKISNFINCWLELDWSGATIHEIHRTIQTAQEMMSDAKYAEMVEIASQS